MIDKNLRAIHDKDYILSLIEQGEHESQDFKFLISDSRKIARSMAAFANNSGGRLLVGVKDNGNIAGIRNEEELFMIEQAAQLYCKPEPEIKQKLYCVDGKYVLLVEISRSKKRPIKAQDDNREWKLYYRVNDENVASPTVLAEIMKAEDGGEVKCDHADIISDVLKVLVQIEPASIRDIAIATHISEHAIKSVIVYLCSIRLCRIEYIDGKWLFRTISPE